MSAFLLSADRTKNPNNNTPPTLQMHVCTSKDDHTDLCHPLSSHRPPTLSLLVCRPSILQGGDMNGAVRAVRVLLYTARWVDVMVDRSRDMYVCIIVRRVVVAVCAASARVMRKKAQWESL